MERVTGLLDAVALEARVGGPRPVLSAAQVAQARELIDSGVSLAQVARAFHVTRATLYGGLARESQGAFGGVRAERAAMKAELAQLRMWHDQAFTNAPSDRQVTQ